MIDRGSKRERDKQRKKERENERERERERESEKERMREREREIREAGKSIKKRNGLHNIMDFDRYQTNLGYFVVDPNFHEVIFDWKKL